MGKIKDALSNLLSQKISYKRYDAGKVAKDIRTARKQNATKKYKDAVDTGYRVLGKPAPKRKDTRKPLPTPKNRGVGWGH